jgi:nucleoside-diphosphate-sugar epimerase
MKILLTGANGFLGSILQQKFKENDLTTLGRSSTDVIADLASTVPVFEKSYDLVIHAAGRAHIYPISFHEINLFHEVNVQGTANLLNGLKSAGLPKYFVFISSVSVYGLETGIDINEETPLAATDPYGKSKIEAEKLVTEWCAHHQVICTILRLPLIAGPNPPGNLGFMLKGLQSGFYFNIGGGKAKKSMVLAEDIANNLIAAAQTGGIYNLTDGEHPTFLDLSRLMANALNKSFVPNIPYFLAWMLAKIGDLVGAQAPFNSIKLKKITSSLTFSDAKARVSFGWNPTPVLKGF